MRSVAKFSRAAALLKRHADVVRAVLVTVVAALVCVGLLWFGTVHTLHAQREAAELAGLENTGNLARVFADNTARGVRLIDDTLLYLRDSYARDPATFDLAVWSQNRQFLTGLTFQVSLIGADGVLLASNIGKPSDPVDLSDRDHFRAHLGAYVDSLFISRPVLGRFSGKWSVQMSRRVMMLDGRFGGVAVVSVDPSYLADFYSTIDLGPNGSIVLAGRDGVVRARTAGDGAVNLGQPVPDAPWLSGERPAGHVLWRSPMDGVERLLAYHRVPDLPLTVLVGQATEDVFADYQRSWRAYVLAAGLLSTMILAAAVTIMSQQLISYRARLALRRSAAEQQATLENMSQGIMMIDADGTVPLFNPRVIDLLGLPHHLVEGRPQLQEILRWQLLQHEFGPEGSPVHEIVRQNENDAERAYAPPTYERQRQDGRWLEVRSVAMADGRMVRTFTDITDRKETERVLAAARDAAEAATRARAEFLAVMSHEMRTPLNGVIGMATLLRDSGLRDDQAAFAETLDSSARHLLQLIDDVLDFSRLDAGKIALEESDFDPAAVVGTIAGMLAPPAEEKGLKVACCIDPTLPAVVRGDAGRLRQVLLNLAGNAVKFTAAGGLAITARVLAGASQGQLRIAFSVIDTGIGIEPTARPLLFREFAQADSSISRRFGGTGLGLAISRRLAEAMGGEIGFDSEPGLGTTFHFDIRVHGTAAAVARPLAGRRLLVVDDLAVSRTTVAQQLSAYGAWVVEVDTPGAALDAVRAAHRAGQFDAVLLDCDEAAAVANRLRAAGGPDLRLILVAGPGTVRRMASAFVFDATLVRPVTLASLAPLLSRGAQTPAGAPILTSGGSSPLVLPARPASVAARLPQLGLRILLAEDNAVNQRVATAMLARMGCRADIVENGLTALEAATHGAYDLVLMDMMMPEMDGLTALRTLRAMPPPTGRLPVVMLTAAASVDDVAESRAAGADAFLAKPIDFEQLQTTLGRFVRDQPLEAATGT